MKNKLVFYFTPFVVNQFGKVIYQDDKEPICEVQFRANDPLKFQELVEDYNIGEIEIYNSKMAKPFTELVKKTQPEINFTLKD